MRGRRLYCVETLVVPTLALYGMAELDFPFVSLGSIHMFGSMIMVHPTTCIWTCKADSLGRFSHTDYVVPEALLTPYVDYSCYIVKGSSCVNHVMVIQESVLLSVSAPRSF